MCGIAGIFHYADRATPVDRPLLAAMTRAVAHRGPDDEQLWVRGPLGLGHRRLSIVDLTPTGRQPMESNGSVLVYNGEAYNHAGFRARLEARGATFRGSSDTETLLHLLAIEGADALTDVAGIFGLAFWDAPRNRLVLARDPLGVKQVYFHDDGKRILFASEIKSLLLAHDVSRAIDPVAVNEYLHFHGPLFDRTFLRDVKQVRAGEYVEIDAHGRRHRRYWTVDGFSDGPVDPEAHVDQLKALLADVVREQLMSDVPVGAFFSGGIDSTAVAAFAKPHVTSLRCFGVHFANAGVIDERPFQELAAKALGLQLDLTTCDGSTFPEDLMRLMYFQDQPVIGPALIPMYYVSKLASQHVKVCLGGQAADEIFGGYARHALVDPLRVARSWFTGRARAQPTSVATNRSAGGVRGNLLKQLLDLDNARRLLERVPEALDWRARYFAHFARISEATCLEVLDPSLVSRAGAFSTFLAGVSESPATAPLDKIFHWEMRTYLASLFQQDDRMSMANSLESRVPLADPRVVRFAMRTPPALKLRGGATKWILRQAIADRIPSEVLNRRKVGFDTPAAAWMRGPHAGFVKDLLLSSRARGRGWYNAAGVERLLASDGAHGSSSDWFQVAWKLLCIEAWATSVVDAPIAQRDTPSEHATEAG
jgi:asparagine synthase (glutamine-hydrolysing)